MEIKPAVLSASTDVKESDSGVVLSDQSYNKDMKTKQDEEEDPGVFDGVFSDSEEEPESSDDEEDEEKDYSSGVDDFVAAAKKRKELRDLGTGKSMYFLIYGISKIVIQFSFLQFLKIP